MQLLKSEAAAEAMQVCSQGVDVREHKHVS